MSDVESAWASLDTVSGQAVLRLERRLAHPVEKVWRAVTDPAELAHWFPARVESELTPGAAIRFTFEGDDESTSGEVLEFDPPKVFAFSWNGDVLRFELVPDEGGCVLYFSQVHSEGNGGRRAAGRNAAGWDVCFAALEARLVGATSEPPADGMLGLVEAYVDHFGLGEGEILPDEDGYRLRFERDLLWRPLDEAWQVLTGEQDLRSGGPVPVGATHRYLEAGPVTAVDPPRLLEYGWLHDGKPAGTVSIALDAHPTAGHRIVLAQTVPAALAYLRPTALGAWHTFLELFFAALLGDVRPWPERRTEQLSQMYADRLSALGTVHATADGRVALRFERAVPHPRDRVWRALADSAELAAWFPAHVDMSTESGATLRFELTEEAKLRHGLTDEQATSDGEVTAVKDGTLLEYTWAGEMLRWQLSDDADGGCQLVFTTVFGNPEITADQGAAWHAALEVLEAHLDDRDVDWSPWERADQLATEYADIGRTVPEEA